MSLILFCTKEIDSLLKIYQLIFLFLLIRIIKGSIISLPGNLNLKGGKAEHCIPTVCTCVLPSPLIHQKHSKKIFGHQPFEP